MSHASACVHNDYANIITLCTVCAEGLCDWSCLYVLCMHVIIYIMSQNIARLVSSQSKISRRLSAHSIFFTLRHCECDSRLPFHPRLSAAPVSLLLLVSQLGSCGSGGWGGTVILACHASLLCMNIYSSTRQLTQPRQRVQCRTPATAVHAVYCYTYIILQLQYSESACSVHTCVLWNSIVI